jgi:hypothetical protein
LGYLKAEKSGSGLGQSGGICSAGPKNEGIFVCGSYIHPPFTVRFYVIDISGFLEYTQFTSRHVSKRSNEDDVYCHAGIAPTSSACM